MVRCQAAGCKCPGVISTDNHWQVSRRASWPDEQTVAMGARNEKGRLCGDGEKIRLLEAFGNALLAGALARTEVGWLSLAG